MTRNELSKILSDRLAVAAKGDRAMTIHLFGIEFGREISACDASPKDIAIGAGINESYGTEIQKGVRLSERVSLTPAT